MERFNRLRQRLLERENRRWDDSLDVDTRGWLIPTKGSTVGDTADGFPYAATHVRLARALLRDLRPLATDATFMDLGSGKGRMLLLAAELPFTDVVGVEYSHELHETALANLASRETATRQNGQPRPRSLLLDVGELEFPPTPLVVYFNNPFPEAFMREVLTNLSSSYRQRPRPVTLVYQQLRDEDPEHATHNRELIGALPFLSPRAIQLHGLLNRALLRPYALNGYASAETRVS